MVKQADSDKHASLLHMVLIPGCKIYINPSREAWYLTVKNLKAVWAEFSTLS
jgi:hypothetical protein